MDNQNAQRGRIGLKENTRGDLFIFFFFLFSSEEKVNQNKKKKKLIEKNGREKKKVQTKLKKFGLQQLNASMGKSGVY